MTQAIIDVREYPEFAAGHIQNAQLVPLATVGDACSAWDKSRPLLLVCKSGRRAEQARQKLIQRGFTDAIVLPGGMDAWSAAGKPVVKESRQPWAMERQVRTVAGALVAVTVLLGVTTSHYFLIGTALVGCGLVFAGVSNTCMMASLLGRMPWNKARA
ncbi:MAG TPA: rhodanese-like domain-containing protein [Acidobacteriaceae bacterium]|nr:rhodanese-like domain-containing protein [Acidobacteriaceae bacterium]